MNNNEYQIKKYNEKLIFLNKIQYNIHIFFCFDVHNKYLSIFILQLHIF